MTSSVQPPALTNTARSPLPVDLPTARFTAFMTEVLAGRIPSGLSRSMHDAFTSTLVSQTHSMFARFGKFQMLQFIGQATDGKDQRYLYAAVFDKGTQAVTFYTNISGEITGFFLL